MKSIQVTNCHDIGREIADPLAALLAQKSHVVLAIDGRCASGKTTLSRLLAQQYECPVIHMDDFFLPPPMRTPQRLAEPGGNVHRERFIHDVLTPLGQHIPFSYKPFDCHRGEMGDDIHVPASPLLVVEGSYACHPAMQGFYDMKIYLTVSKDKQKARLELSNGPVATQVFLNKWIPLEEAYFQAFGIKDACDFLFEMI